MMSVKISDYLSLELFTSEPETNPQGSIDLVGGRSFIRGCVWFNVVVGEGVDEDAYFKNICWSTFNDVILGRVESSLRDMELDTPLGKVTDNWISAETDQYVSPNTNHKQSPSRIIHRAPINHILNRRPGTVTVGNINFTRDNTGRTSPHQVVDGNGVVWRTSGIKLKRFGCCDMVGFDPICINDALTVLKNASVPLGVFA